MDATKLSKKALVAFFEQIAKAKADGVLFSLHIKATMMKAEPPDHLRPRGEDLEDLVAKHTATLAEIGVNLAIRN